MASIHHKQGSRNWYCCFTLPGGKRVYLSTGTHNRAAAMRRACELEAEALAAAKAAAAPQRAVLAHVKEAATLAERGGLSLEQAREIVGRIVATATGREVRFYSARQWGEEWLAGKTGSTAASSQSTYRRSVHGFLAFLEARADEPLECLTEADFRGYRDALRGQRLTARTCNQIIKVLRGWMRSAVNQGLLGRNPCSSVPALLETDSVTREPFTPEELARLVDVASGSWRGVILLGIYGGLRLRDATNLRWSAVDLAAGVIRYLPLKTARRKREVVLPIHPSLLAYLKTLPLPIHPSNLLFPDLAGKSTGGKFGLSIGFNTLLADAGIERDRYRVESDGSRTRTAVRTFHSLRHTFASLLAKGGVSEGMRMDLAGHKSPDMARHYTHHEIETLRAAVGTLPAIG